MDKLHKLLQAVPTIKMHSTWSFSGEAKQRCVNIASLRNWFELFA